MAINMYEGTGPIDHDASTTTAECCAPGVPIDHTVAARVAETLTALADPVRLQILSMIATAPDGEVCACDFVGPIDRSQPTVSHHLKVLATAGVVTTERRGRWIWYRLAPDAHHAIAASLRDVFA
ncbi:MAG: metalloregulator ArsR/SmtB family transcription factor [Actinomycetota bacterium]